MVWLKMPDRWIESHVYCKGGHAYLHVNVKTWKLFPHYWPFITWIISALLDFYHGNQYQLRKFDHMWCESHSYKSKQPFHHNISYAMCSTLGHKTTPKMTECLPGLLNKLACNFPLFFMIHRIINTDILIILSVYAQENTSKQFV